MAKKILPIVTKDNHVKSECWTNLILSIIQTSEHYQAWLASHIGIFGTDDNSCWYGNLSKIFSYRDSFDILNFEEVNIWSVPPENIISFLHNELDQENYVILEFKHIVNQNDNAYWIHEQLIFGYDDERKVFFGSSTNSDTGAHIDLQFTYDELKTIYSCSYEHFKSPSNKEDFIFWSRSNFLITRINLRKDYTPQGSEYSFIQNLIIEKDGKEYTSIQYDDNFNIIMQQKMYSGVACLIGAKKYIDRLWNEKHFIDQDTDIQYNDLFGRVSLKLAKDFYKLYEHRIIILHLLKWFYTKTNIVDFGSSIAVKEYELCCHDMNVYYQTALKFSVSRDWNVLKHLIEIFSTHYSTEYNTLGKLVIEMKEIWHKFKLNS